MGAIEPLIEATVAFRYGTSDMTKAEDGEEDGGSDEVPTEALRGYWATLDRWARLSPYGQEAIGKLVKPQRQA